MMTRPARSPRRSRRWLLERLESRDVPAIVSFRSGVNDIVAYDVAISKQSPNQSNSMDPVLQVEGKTGSTNHSQVLLRFDNIMGTGPGQIPPQATIVHANLVFWATDGASVTAPIKIYRLMQPWDPNTTTWDSWNDGVETNNVEAFFGPDSAVTFGRTGYQATGQSLKQSLQLWANGEANYGWVIMIDDSQGQWRTASSEASVIAHRPCLNVEFTAPGYTNPSYEELVGAPPLATTLEWFDWNNDLRNQRVARIPQVRATTFYFSQSGDDLTGLGTLEQPWKTLAKAKDVLDESGGQGLRLRFRRGDEWNEATHFRLGNHVSGFTIDDYGDSALDKPLMTRFLPLAELGWQHVSGNLYKYVNPGSVGWLRESADGFSRVYYRGWSSDEVALRTQSWFYDAAGLEAPSGGQPTLYLNCGQNPALVPGGFEACPSDGLGWEVRGDNVRMENVRLEGYGVSVNGQSYGLAIGHESALREFVGIGIDVYYTGYHAVGHIVQYMGSKGAATLIDVSAGLCVNRDGNGDPGSGDTTVFVAYGDYGGNEYISYNCEAKYGTLPSADWAATPGAAHGSAFYCHVGPGGTLDLVIMEKTRTGNYGHNVRARNAFDNLPAAANLSQVRGFLVEDGPGPGISRYIGSDLAVINCVFDYTDPPREFDYHYAFHHNAISKGWLINCTIAIDAVNQTSFYFFVMHSLYLNRVNAIHCHIDIFNAERPLYWDVPFETGPTYVEAKLTNSIVSFSTTETTGLGMPNNSDVLQHNAYYLPNLNNPAWGFSNDPGAVTLQRRYPVGLRPTTSSPLYNSGLSDVLDYYQDRSPRGAVVTIGPLSEVDLPAPVSVAAHWGMRSANLNLATQLWSPRIDRISVDFGTNVDVGITALEIVGANGPSAWSGMTINAATGTAEWKLTEPLPSGQFSVYLEGQLIRTFSVRPGDFNGDGLVTAPDFFTFRQNYGTSAFEGDLDGNGLISAVDFDLFRQFYGLMV